MKNPQKHLYSLLAKSSAHLQSVQGIANKARSQIPQQQQRMQAEINQLRSQIQTAGIGADPESEARYLDLLTSQRRLEQIHMMNPPSASTIVDSPVEDESLQKALRHGQLLLEIYGDGLLIKSAIADIQNHIGRLVSFDHPRSDCLALDLLKAARRSPFQVGQRKVVNGRTYELNRNQHWVQVNA